MIGLSDWIASTRFPDKPWLVLGKGPTFARLGDDKCGVLQDCKRVRQLVHNADLIAILQVAADVRQIDAFIEHVHREKDVEITCEKEGYKQARTLRRRLPPADQARFRDAMLATVGRKPLRPDK